MKKFIFRYEKNPLKKSFQDIKKAIKSKKPDIKENEIICDTLDSISQIMSKTKLEIFAGILEYHPKSIAELAKLLKKDQANVLREVRSLEAIGIIKLVKELEGKRERLRPVSRYDTIVFDFGHKMPKRKVS